MTPDEFRNLALRFPGAIESAHMNHPDFRAGGRIFATLGYPDDTWAMVKLTPDQQRDFLEQAPEVFRPCAGAWGIGGATNIALASAPPRQVKAALESAFKNATEKKVRKRRT